MTATKILVLGLVSFLCSTAHAQLKVALGDTLYQWRSDVLDSVRLEETRVTGCHQDGSLTLTRLTMTQLAARGAQIPARSTVRVSNGDIFLLYGREGEPVKIMLYSVTRCVGEFGSPHSLGR